MVSVKVHGFGYRAYGYGYNTYGLGIGHMV